MRPGQRQHQLGLADHVLGQLAGSEAIHLGTLSTQKAGDRQVDPFPNPVRQRQHY